MPGSAAGTAAPRAPAAAAAPPTTATLAGSRPGGAASRSTPTAAAPVRAASGSVRATERTFRRSVFRVTSESMASARRRYRAARGAPGSSRKAQSRGEDHRLPDQPGVVGGDPLQFVLKVLDAADELVPDAGIRGAAEFLFDALRADLTTRADNPARQIGFAPAP